MGRDVDVLKLPLLNNFNFSNETLMDLEVILHESKDQENLEQALKQKTPIPFKWGTAKGENNSN